MTKLKDVTIKALSEAGRYSDGNNLYLQITKTGSKSWLFMYKWQGKQREMGLGPYPAISLAKAREAANHNKALLLSPTHPQDPMTARDIEKALAKSKPTFGVFALGLISDLESEWRNEKHRSQWKNTLSTYAKPIWQKTIDEIDTTEVLKCLKPIWQTKPETASRVRGRIEKVLNAAKAKGLRSGENPASWRGHLDHLLPSRQKLSRGHHPALPYNEVREFIGLLRSREALSALALEALILCGSRSGELLGVDWQEIDLEHAVWTVPAVRMKTKKDHRVPLTKRVLEILESVKPLSDTTNGPKGYVFKGRDIGKPLSSGAFDRLYKRMEKAGLKSDHFTTHGFRSAFRDWAYEVSSFPREVAEAALSHALGDATERAYRRGDALEKRRLMMEAWANYVEPQSGGANVVQLAKIS